MKALLKATTSSYDMVLIDSPPVLPVTDAAVLGRQVDGALIVAGMDRIHRPQLRDALESLETAGCTVLGLVINKIARREVGPTCMSAATTRPRTSHSKTPGASSTGGHQSDAPQSEARPSARSVTDLADV